MSVMGGTEMCGKKTDEDNIDRFCAYCEYGKPIPSSDGETLVACGRKGLVDGGYVCGKFRYDPLKREPKRKKTETDYEIVDLNE